MKRKLIPLTLCIITSVSICAQQSRPEQRQNPKTSDAKIARELGAHLEELAAADEFSGGVLVARDGRPIFAKAYGFSNKNGAVMNTVDTKFDVGSMTKMFTAVAIAQLAECGKLSFNDPVGKHLPNYPNKTVSDTVTIHHLLTHTSGMGDYQNETFYSRLDQMRTLADLQPLFVNDPLKFEPGTNWEYSNAGFVVLGLIIEKVSRQSYFDYMAQHIFKRAGMADTNFFGKDEEVPNRAVGYRRVNGKGEPDPAAQRRENTSMRPAKGSPAGGAYSTVADMLKFYTAFENHKLLNAKYRDIVTAAKTKVPPGWPMSEYGYGFTISVVNGNRILGHGGAGPGISGKFEIFPEQDYLAVILSNYDLPAIMPVIMKTRGLILNQ